MRTGRNRDKTKQLQARQVIKPKLEAARRGARYVPHSTPDPSARPTLCPYSDKKNLRLSWKKILTVESRSETARNLPSGLYLTARTSSVILRVRTWTRVSCLDLY
jgi:hypothetical protein